MIIVLDANIFIKDFTLRSTPFQVFLEGISRIGYVLTIPKIILDETINKYGEQFEKKSRDLGRLGLQDLKFITGEAITCREDAERIYRKYLEKTLKGIKTKIVDLPDIKHSTLIERALKRKKPFRGTDTGGYRDALVWMTVLQLAFHNDAL